MKTDLKLIFDNPAGTRRAIISRARKNAKTFEAALLTLLFLCGPEARANGQLYSAAQSREQAAILFAMAAKMVRLNRALSDFVTVRETVKELACADLGTKYRALSAEARTAFGLNPMLAIHDELGLVRGPRSELYEAIETATGAQANPLSVIISTQAPTDDDLLSILIDDAKAGHDPRIVLRLDTAGEDMLPFSKEAIRAANPAFNHFMNRREVLAMAREAERMPTRQAEYENLVLNRRVEARAPFVSRLVWNQCAGAVAEFDPELPVYAGLDLSEVRDLTALVLIGCIDGVWHVRPTFWLPADGLADKARADRVPYDLWRERGFLETAPGASVDYSYVAAHLVELFARFNIQKVGFDRWNMRHLRPWLEQAGLPPSLIDERFVQFGQGTQSMSPALRVLEAEIVNQRIAHGGHPVLKMCAANAVVEGKDSSNRKLSKSNSPGRIDGMVALAMAFGVTPEKASVEIAALVA